MPAATIEMLIRLTVIKRRIAIADGFERHAPLRPSEYQNTDYAAKPGKIATPSKGCNHIVIIP